MQVCRNGHVITDLLHTFPERARSHCDRCGAATLDRCQTCGQEIPGAVYVPEAAPIGVRRPPEHCSACGAAFPWTARRQARPAPASLAVVEALLRRLPLVARQLRDRHGSRPPFRISDEHDLEDLVRALLPLHFDDVRYECRTPGYATGSRTDFLLVPSAIALTVKCASPILRQERLGEQLAEDIFYYRHKSCRTLVACIFDPEKILSDPGQLETAWAALSDEVRVLPVVAS
jgi:REase_DpnII-MboI/Uncharacterized protein conserved in bacteria (DUF2321)